MKCARIGSPLSKDALYEIATTRPSLTIFPNLQSLCTTWDSPFLSPTFTSSTVTHLSISFETYTDEGDALVLSKADQIVESMPNIMELNLLAKKLVPFWDTLVCRLLSGLPYLVKLTMPPRRLSSAIASVAARSPKLRSLGARGGLGLNANIPSFAPVLHTGAFQSLKELYFAASLSDALAFIKHPNVSFHQLDVLALSIDATRYTGPPSSDLFTFLHDLPTVCPCLKVLRLVIREATKRAPSIRFVDIEPVINFKRLTKFVLRNLSAIEMTDEEAEVFARGLPKLRHLQLTRRQASEPHRALTLRSLTSFATHCSDLQHLEICLNALTNLPTPSAAVCFPRLRKLHLGYSTIFKTIPVAQFLSRSLPDDCIIAGAEDEITNGAVKHHPASNAGLRDSWREVQALVSVLKEEISRTRTDVERSLTLRISAMEQQETRLKSELSLLLGESGEASS